MNHEELLDHARIKLDPIGLKLVCSENPVAASRSPQNTLFHACDVHEQRRSYASCLNIMDLAFEAGDDELFVAPECQQAIRKGICPAIKMRKAELLAGRALFYVDYTKMMALRAEKMAYDLENSPLQFRRNKSDRKFVPSTVSSGKIHETPQVFKSKPKPPVEKPTDELDTNIMEQVLKKVLNDNTSN